MDNKQLEHNKDLFELLDLSKVNETERKILVRINEKTDNFSDSHMMEFYQALFDKCIDYIKQDSPDAFQKTTIKVKKASVSPAQSTIQTKEYNINPKP